MVNVSSSEIKNETDEAFKIEKLTVESVAWESLCGLLCVPTVLGNSFILVSVIKYNGVRSSIHTLIGNLAVSDLIVGAILFPFSIITAASGLNSHKYVCLTKAFLLVLSIGGTCYGLLLVSVDRFVAVCYPMQYVDAFTTRRLTSILVCGWTYVAFWACLPLSGWNFYDINLPYNCFTDRVFTPVYQKVMIANFCFIILLNFILYIIVMRIAVRKSMQIYAEERLFSFRRDSRDIYKVKTMGIVQGLFLVCWLPFLVTSICASFYHIPTVSKIQNWTLGLGLMNSTLNWIIYGYRNKQLRNRMKAYMTCCPKFQEETFVTNSNIT